MSMEHRLRASNFCGQGGAQGMALSLRFKPDQIVTVSCIAPSGLLQASC